MFDTFDLQVPRLVTAPGFSIRQHQTAFGPDERRMLYWGEVRLGWVLPAYKAYSALAAWTGSADRANWEVVALHNDANTAAAQETTWADFLDALRAVLHAHAHWRIMAESDCDQHPREALPLDADGVVALLDEYRRTSYYPISFNAEYVAGG